jgi:hypothetical protein
MSGASKEELASAVLRKAIEVHQPYRKFRQSKDMGFDNKGWVIVYVSPRDQSRSEVMRDLDKRTANDFIALLEVAWIEGYRASHIE